MEFYSSCGEACRQITIMLWVIIENSDLKSSEVDYFGWNDDMMLEIS